MRCPVCPAVGDEPHDEKCHAVHDRLWEEYFAEVEQQLNTEVVNQ